MSFASARDALTGAVGYFLLASTTIFLTSDGRNHATVWPADAVILALLLNAPRRRWPIILVAGWVGNLVANGVARGWMAGLLLYGAINMGQTLIAALLLERGRSEHNLLQDFRSVSHFFLFAGIVAPLFGAAAGSLASLINYGQPLGPSFVRWYASNALGLLVVTPFLKALLDGSYKRCFQEKSRAALLESLALLGIHAVLTTVVFAQSTLPLLFLPMSSLLVLAFRLGTLGTMAGVICVALAGAIGAYYGVGPTALIQHAPVWEAIFFQTYLAVILLTALPVAAVVSSHGQALRKLGAREQTLRQIMSHSPDAILVFDEFGICNWADGRIQEHIGLTKGELLGHSLNQIAPHIDHRLLHVMPDADGVQEAASVEISPRRRPQKTLEASTGILMQDGRRGGVALTLHDVSERKSREAALYRLVETDELTGVLNRKGFRARLGLAIEDASSPCTLALVDVDHFKSINDNYGHAIGDKVLQLVAARLTGGTRGTDLVGRLGGDEFAILFRGDTRVAEISCRRITHALRHEPIFEDGDCRVMVTISCGLAEHRVGMSRGELFDRADNALYDVKRSGRGEVRASA